MAVTASDGANIGRSSRATTAVLPFDITLQLIGRLISLPGTEHLTSEAGRATGAADDADAEMTAARKRENI